METNPQITLNADVLKSDIEAKSEPKDNKSRQEFEDLENKRKLLHNKSIEQDIEERKSYAETFTNLVTIWLFMIGIVVIGAGTGHMWFSENVMLALIGTSTFNLVGLLYVIANYLFPQKKKDE